MLLIQWITTTQTDAFKEWVLFPAVGAALWAFLSRAITKSREKIHVMLTENANRTRDEVIIHVDKRFAEHETKAFERLDSQDKAAAETAKRVDEFEKQLAELRAELKALADSLRKREP